MTSRRFVGRRQEIVELSSSLDDAIAGRGRLFLLSGEPGIGKSRLAEEIADRGRVAGFRVAWGRCWEGDGAPAYWPWIQVVRACLAEAHAQQRNVILGFEGTPLIAQDIAQLLPELHAAHPTSTSRPQPSDPEQARFQFFQSVASVLKLCANRAVADRDRRSGRRGPSFARMQKFIAGQTKDARILMVGTYRDTEVKQSAELSNFIGDLNREVLRFLSPG